MPQQIQIDHLPDSIEDFISMQERLSFSPQGGAAMLVLALLLYAEKGDLGSQCLSVAVDANRLTESKSGYQGWQLHKRELQLIEQQIKRQAFLPRSYLSGCTPENGYALPDAPYAIECSSNPYSGDEASGEFKVFVKCSGAASPRPVSLRRDPQGLWKAREWSSLLVGIMDPT